MSGERRGFTLIELLIVMSIIGLLLALAMPRYFNSLERSKVTALREDLRVMRVQIDRFYGDLGRYPKSLEELVELKYLRSIPVDPITESVDTWQTLAPPDQSEGIVDVASGATGNTREGVAFAEL